jgi:hypothetical protein
VGSSLTVDSGGPGIPGELDGGSVERMVAAVSGNWDADLHRMPGMASDHPPCGVGAQDRGSDELDAVF